MARRRVDRAALPLDTVMEGDCREVLAGLPERSVDLVFADPPYNLQLEEELLRPNMTQVDAVTDAWDAFGSFAEYDRFTEEWLRACRRVMSDDATLWVIGSYHNIYRVGKILMDLGYWILNDLVWRKTNPMPQFRGVRFTNAHETLLWVKKSARQKRYTFNYHLMKHLNGGLQMRSDWQIPLCTGSERLKENGRKLHSTQKPEALLERVILSSSYKGDVVLDPFFGTGTTGAVARRLGRRWIGIERDPTYAEAARRRIAAVEESLPEEWLALERRNLQRPRVAFAELVAAGMIPPGTRLYFHRSDNVTATVLPDGQLRLGDQVGSIHAIGRLAGSLPACNGWVHWWFDDPESGRRLVIDALREEYRAKQGGQVVGEFGGWVVGGREPGWCGDDPPHSPGPYTHAPWT